MISLTVAQSVVAASTVGVVAGLWGAFVSVRSAVLGPEWALEHMKRVLPAFIVVTGLGVLVMIWVRPIWVGLSVVYVGMVLVIFARRIGRSLAHVQAYGDLDPLPKDRQAAVLEKASWSLLAGGLIVMGLAVLDVTARGWQAAFDFLLAGALLVPGFLYARTYRQMRSELEPS